VTRGSARLDQLDFGRGMRSGVAQCEQPEHALGVAARVWPYYEMYLEGGNRGPRRGGAFPPSAVGLEVWHLILATCVLVVGAKLGYLADELLPPSIHAGAKLEACRPPPW